MSVEFLQAQDINQFNWEITKATRNGEEIDFSVKTKDDYFDCIDVYINTNKEPPIYEQKIARVICLGIMDNVFHDGDRHVISITEDDGSKYEATVEIHKKQ